MSSIAADNGLKPFAMFEFTPFGLIILTAGFIYFYALRKKRIRDLKEDDNFVVVSDVPVERYSTKKIPIALTVLAGVVFTKKA